MPVEEIPNSTSGNTQKRTTSNPIEEPGHQHGLNVLGHRTGNQPDQKEAERNNVDISSAVKLASVSENHKTQ